MAAITSRAEIIKRIAKGQCALSVISPSVASGTITAANSTSNFNTINLMGPALGSTFGTAYGTTEPPAQSGTYSNFLSYNGCTTAARGGSFGRIYKIGTVAFTATGDQFTHDAATFPLLRTDWNGASQNVRLLPLLTVTVSVGTSPATFILKTNVGGAGYSNQNNTGVVGTKVFTTPAATTAVGSTYILRLETGDYAITDITQINIGTSSAGGTGDIWGLELFDFAQTAAIGQTYTDNLNSGMFMCPTSPAVATSGTVTSRLVCIGSTTSATTMHDIHLSVLTS